MIEQEDNCTAILELNKSLGSADVIFFSELARVKKKTTSAQQARQYHTTEHFVKTILQQN